MFRSVRDFLVSTALIALPLAALAGVGAVALQHLPPRAGWVAAALLVLGLGVWVVRRRSRGLAALPRPSPWQREMDALKAIAQVMARGSDLATTAEAILDVVRQAAGFEAGIVYRLDAAAGALLLLAQRGLDEQTLASARVRPLAGTHEGEAARSGVAHLTRIDRSPRMDAAARRISGRRGQRTRAQLALPIPVQGRTWGVLALVFPEARRVGAAELAALDAVAHQVGLAVERAQLQQTAAARLERLEAQREIERHISEQLDLEQLLVIAARSALRLIGGAFSIVFLREGDLLCPRAWAELPDWIREARVPVGTGVVGTAVAAAEGLIVNDYPSSPLARPPFSNAPLRLLVQPLLARGQALGAMLISRDETRAPFTAEDLSALGDFATQAAVAIENARLFAEAQRSAAEYRALFEVAGLVGSTLDAERVLDVIADRCRALMGVASVGIFELEADTGALVYERGVGLSPGFVRALRVQVGEGTTGRAVAERAPVWSADLLADPAITLAPQTRDLVMREGYRAVLSVPILGSGDVPHGALCAYWWESHEPAPAEIELMSALAGQAAIALENARLYGQAATQAERMRAIADLGRTLVSTLDVGRIVETAVTRAVGTLAVARVGICLEDASTGELRFLEPGGAAGSLLDGPVLQRGEGVAGRALAEGRPVWSADILADPAIVFRPATRARLAGGPPRAILALPLERERPLGALVVQREAGHRFTESEIEYLSVFASQVAVALDNARLYAALDTRADRLRTLARLSTVVSSSLDASAVLQAIVRAAAEMMKAMFVTVYVADETGRVLELRAVSDERMGAALPASRRRFGDGLVGWVAEHRQPLAVPDVFEDERASAVEWARRHGLRSFLGMPIVFQDSLLGVLTLNDPAPFRLAADDERLLEGFVSQAAVAIRNTRLYAETSQRLAETRALLEVAEVLNSTLDPRRVLKQVAIKIAQVCRVDRCTIERWEEDRAVPLMSQFADGRVNESMWAALMSLPDEPPRAVPAHARAIETRRPVVIPDTSATDLIPREWNEAFGHKSFMVVPLIHQDAVIGAMSLDYADRVTPFERWQVDLAMAIGGPLALTIENTRLYGEAQERLRETTTLLAVGRVLSQPGPASQVMHHAAREIGHAFGADMVGVYVLDASREALIPLAGHHVPKHLLELFATRPFVLSRFPLIRNSWRAGRAFWSRDVKNDPRIDPETFAGVDPHSVLFAPTMVRGEAVGGLFLVWWGTGREFQAEEIRLIEGVASQVGLAMENAELARQTQQKLEETERLLAVSRTLASTLDLETLPRQFLRHVVRALGADSAALWLLDGSGEWMDPVVGYHIPRERIEVLRRVRLSIAAHPFYAEAARTRRPVVSLDAAGDPRIPAALRDAAPHRTQLFVPIVVKDRMLGGFAVAWWETARPLAESEVKLMEAIASQAGVALENARLFLDNQRRVEELSVLHELSRAVTGQLDQADLLDTIHQHVARLLDVDHMAILLWEDSSDDLVVALRVAGGVRRDGEPSRYPRRRAGLSGVVADTARPLRTDDYSGECARRGVEPVPGTAGVPNWLGAPMAAGNRLLGVLALRRRDRTFTEGDQRLLANIADLAALALRSAGLYEERARAHGELAAAQDQLVRTEKLRAMGEMASGVAHDFNNVLAAILGRAQLLLKRVEDPKLRQWIQVIELSALDGARTVRRLQDFTRIRRDHPAVAVDLNEVVQQTLASTESTWRHEPQSRGIRIDVTTRLAAALPEVSGDPAELREALTNLILNALDAMPQGGRLGLATSTAAGQVEIAVADTGTGIPTGIRHKIFDPFFTTKGPKGTGLGLSMTYGILARHGARITVDSAEGQGTTFRLTFPALTSAGEPPARPAPSTAPPPSLRCLVVDDEEIVAGVLGDMLASGGHRVTVVGTGREAVDRFGAEGFDLVLTDLAMPGMTGWEVARAIKDVAPAARVVLVSGFGVELAPEGLRDHGVDMVLAKPIKFEDVESAVALARGPHGVSSGG